MSEEQIRFSEDKKVVIDLNSKLKTSIRIWTPQSDPVAVLVAIHGALAHSGDWINVGMFFKEKGIVTIGYDLRYHGEQFQDKKTPIYVNSYDDYVSDQQVILKYAKEQFPGKPIFIIGHSMGGLVSLYYGLNTLKEQSGISGFIISSPWLENKVKVNKILLVLSKVFNIIYPKLPAATESITDYLTHDKEITKRHYRDEDLGLRRTKVTPRFGISTFKAQDFVIRNIKAWKDYPLYCILAGDEYLAVFETSKQALSKISSDLCNIDIYEKNYHENFNELNRDEIFGKIYLWISKIIEK